MQLAQAGWGKEFLTVLSGSKRAHHPCTPMPLQWPDLGSCHSQTFLNSLWCVCRAGGSRGELLLLNQPLRPAAPSPLRSLRTQHALNPSILAQKKIAEVHHWPALHSLIQTSPLPPSCPPHPCPAQVLCPSSAGPLRQAALHFLYPSAHAPIIFSPPTSITPLIPCAVQALCPPLCRDIPPGSPLFQWMKRRSSTRR